MGVNAYDDVDFLAIGHMMSASTMPWMNAWVEIVDPNTAEQIWDEFTNEYVGGDSTVLWSGRARIQQLGGTSTPDVGMSQVGIKQVRVQVPLDVDAGFIRKGLQIHVTNPGNDYALQDAWLTVLSGVNSSYAWLRTIMCELDVKSSGA